MHHHLVGGALLLITKVLHGGYTGLIMEARHLRRMARDYGNGGTGLYGLRHWECMATPELAFLMEVSGN